MEEQGAGELLQEPSEIYRALRALQLTRSLITIKIDQDAQVYSSMILLCDLDNRQFIIDEVRPAIGNQLLNQGAKFTLMGFYEGIQVLCKDNKILSSQVPEVDHAFSIPFPNFIYRKQRRDSYRTHIPHGTRAEIQVTSTSRKPLQGVISDISTSGVGCQFEGYIRPELKAGESFDSAALTINNEFVLHCPLVVRHPHFNQSANITHCGFEFGELDRQEQKRVDKYILSLQRMSRKLANDAPNPLKMTVPRG